MKHKVNVLSKSQVEQGRSNAYKYINFNQIINKNNNIMNKLELIKKDLEEGADYNFDNWNKGDLQMLEEIVIATENVVKKLTIRDVVKSLPTKEEIELRAEQALFGFEEKSRKFDDDYYFGYCNGAEWIKKEITKNRQ